MEYRLGGGHLVGKSTTDIEKIINELAIKFLSKDLILETHNKIKTQCKLNDIPYDGNKINSGGILGLPFLYSSINNLMDNKNYNMNIDEYMDLINNFLGEESLRLSVHQGITGVAYAALVSNEHIPKYSIAINNLNNYINKYINIYIQQMNNNELREELYDVINGLSGIGRYLINFKDDYVCKENINKILSIFIKFTDENLLNEYSKWTLQNKFKWSIDKKYIDLGLAHGIAGPISFMSICILNDIYVEGIEKCLERLVSIYDINEVYCGKYIYWNKIHVICDDYKKDTVSTRPGWCYGNAGISRTLFMAGKALKNMDLQKKALNSILQFNEMKIDEIGFESSSFCHGYSGLLYVTNLFLQEDLDELISHNDIEKLISLKNKIIEKIIKVYDSNLIFGFQEPKYNNRKNKILLDNISLLDGSISIIITLISVLKNSCTKYFSQMMLLN